MVVCTTEALPETSVVESNDDFMRRLNTNILKNRVPTGGGIEITQRCNYRCVHCYLGNQDTIREQKDRELTTQEWKNVITEIADAGGLYLLITGGDPFLRADFGEIYTHARRSGLMVTIFTNGSLMSKRNLQPLLDYPPLLVEITLYGGTAETYEKVTKIPGSFRKAMEGIAILKGAGIKVNLKTVLMTLNQHEYPIMEGIAKKFNAPNFRLDAGIFPAFDGDREPMNYRVDPSVAVDLELSDPRMKKNMADYYEKLAGMKKTDKLYTCGAGLTSYFVDAYGNLKPCVMVHSLQVNVRNGGFLKGWTETIPAIRERKAPEGHSCSSCSNKPVCNSCPAFSDLENGLESRKSKYVCDTGHIRGDKIRSFIQERKQQHAVFNV